MRYDVEGVSVYSENAAQAISKPNRHVISRLAAFPEHWKVLDYGCGRLRYSIPLAERVAAVVAVDSSRQLSRRQRVAGQWTTLAEHAERLRHLRLLDTDTFASSRESDFDAALCINVLSAVPGRAQRLLMLGEIGKRVRPGGLILVSTQYRDHSFSSYSQNPRASQFEDGWLIRHPSSPGRASYYGLIDRPSLELHCEEAGLAVVRSYVHDKSAYVEATPQQY